MKLSLAYFAILGAVIYLFLAPFLWFISIFSLVFPRAMDLYYLILLVGIRIYIKVSPLKFRLKNFNNLSRINQEECLIVSNHRSHLDMFLFLAEVYKLRAMANAGLKKVPFLGIVIWMSGHFFVRRGDVELHKKALANMNEAFRRHDKVLIFPEATRCEPGLQGMNKFHLTAFQLARESGIKIIPVVHHGTDQVWPKHFMGMNFTYPISIQALPPVNPNDFPDSASLAKHVFHIMNEELKVISA